MATPQSLTDAMAALDTDTTALGVVVDGLRAEIKVNMTPAEVEAVTSTLAGVSTRLKGYAHDPDVIVPTAPLPAFKRK